VQVPEFDVSNLLPELALRVRKTSKNTVISTKVVIDAKGVLGAGGIGKKWQAGGIDSDTRVQCSEAAPGSCISLPGVKCTTLWLQSSDCSVLNEKHVAVTAHQPDAWTAEMALFDVTVQTPVVPEGVYRFALHFPINNPNATDDPRWQFATIESSFRIDAIADPSRSDVSLRNPTASSSAPLSGSINHQEALRIDILARDVDGHVINRTNSRVGERQLMEQLLVTVAFVGQDGGYAAANTTQVAQHDPVSGMYFVVVSIKTPGEHAVFVTDVQTGNWTRSSSTFHVVCASGFAEMDRECKEEVNDVQKVVGGTIGTVFLVVAVLALFLLYKNRAHPLRFALRSSNTSSS
jgi:hypothetical protein